MAIDPPPAAAQAPVAFARIPAGSGLSQNTVNALVQDRTGFLWVATRDGLNRYDGYGFVTYRHHPDDPRSLCHDHVLSLYESVAGDLWVGTEAGLCRYDRAANQFERVAALRVSAIREDRYGGVWLRSGVASSRITRLDIATATTRSFGPFAARRMVSVAGEIWIDTPDGARRYDAPSDTWMPVNLPSVAGAPSRIVAAAPGDGVWLYGGRELARWHPGRDEVARAGARVPSPVTDGLDAAPLTSLLEFEGAVYVGTAHGLYRRQSQEHTWTEVPLGAATDRLTRSVRSLYVDRAGTLWAGTMAGLFRADPYAKRFARLALDQPPGAPATAFLEAAEDQLWIGTLGGGILRVDARDEDVIWMLHADASGLIWAATDHGLMRLDPAHGTRHHFLLLPDNGRRPGSNAFTSLAADPDGAIWAGTYSGAVVRFDPATEKTEVYEAWAGRSRPVQALHHDGETLWVGGHRRGVRRFDTRARRLLPADAGDAAFQDASVWMFHSGTDGRLWAATNEGLFARDRESGVATRYLDPGLPSSVVYAVGEDAMGRIWASPNGGLLLLDPRKPPGRRFLLFGPADGVPASEFTRRAVLAARDGRLLFGALDGIVWFDPARVRLNERPPAVAIASVGVHGRAGDRTFYPHAGEPLILAPGDTSVSFDVVALSLTDAGRNRYSYRLDGFDAEWSAPSGHRRARYTNVPAGRYVFRVRGSNSDGVWNEEGAVLDVVVHAPYWQQWWFRLLAGALVVGLALTAHRSRLRRLLGVERIRQQVPQTCTTTSAPGWRTLPC